MGRRFSKHKHSRVCCEGQLCVNAIDHTSVATARQLAWTVNELSRPAAPTEMQVAIDHIFIYLAIDAGLCADEVSRMCPCFVQATLGVEHVYIVVA